MDIYSYIDDAFREINIAPARKLPQKETSFPTNHFRCSGTVYNVYTHPPALGGPSSQALPLTDASWMVDVGVPSSQRMLKTPLLNGKVHSFIHTSKLGDLVALTFQKTCLVLIMYDNVILLQLGSVPGNLASPLLKINHPKVKSELITAHFFLPIFKTP